jgi:hypothetical protein
MRRFIGGLAVVAMLVGFAGTASAVPIAWTFNFSQAGLVEGSAGITNVGPITQTTYFAETHTFFQSAGEEGDLFFGLSLIQPTSFRNANTVVPNANYQVTHELTAALAYRGVQGPVSAGLQSFTITEAHLILFFDAGAFTLGNFGAANLGTLVDGTQVETGAGKGAGSNDGTIANGASKITFAMTDLLSGHQCGGSPCNPFEIANGFSIDFAIAASDNEICDVGGTTCGDSVGSDFQTLFAAIFGAQFGFGGNDPGFDPADFDGLTLHVGSDGSFTKEGTPNVPGPLPLIVIGVGMLGMGIARHVRSRRA